MQYKALQKLSGFLARDSNNKVQYNQLKKSLVQYCEDDNKRGEIERGGAIFPPSSPLEKFTLSLAQQIQ